MTDIWTLGRLDGVAQAALVAAGELRSIDLVDAAIARIEALEPRINAVSWPAFDAARRAAARFDSAPIAGPLAGVPYLVKDSLDYPGMVARSGSRARRPTVAESAGALVKAYDAAGLIALGKSAMPEFALLASTEPVLAGPTINPWAPGRTIGGSSGGAAAAVATGMVPVAHASDGGGSIRIPAACAGLIGLKPSRGANVRARGPHAIEDLLTTDGLLARTVRDVAAGFVIGGGPPPDPATRHRPLRIALIVDSLGGKAPEPAVAAAVETADRLCTELGHRVDLACYPIDTAAVVAAFEVAWTYLGGEVVDVMRAIRGGEADRLLEPWTLGLAARRWTVPDTALEAMMAAMGTAPAAFARFFEDFDCILSPVLRGPPQPLGTLAGTRDFDALWTDLFDQVSYTPLHNLAGLPAISVPIAIGADGPIGVMLAAARGDDQCLLSLAAQLEEAVGWADRWPAIVPGAA